MSESGIVILRKSIEELPDEVLAEILSRLNTKEAVRVCTVSRRWRNLWKLCRNLDLDFLDQMYNEIDVLRCVDFVFHNHQPDVDLDRLRIAFWSNDFPGCATVDHSFREWFTFANAKRVQILDIDNHSNAILTVHKTSVWAPPKTAMALNSWDRLTTLSLKAVILDDADVDLLLSKSPNLETLSLDNVPLTKLVLKDTNSRKLKRLKIYQCHLFERFHVVSALNLECFKYYPETNLNPCAYDVWFMHAPKLVAIDLCGILCGSMVLKVQECVPQLQKLQLDMFFDCHGCPFHMPILENLKQLELRFTSNTTKHYHNHDRMETAKGIIDSCPSLEKLTLKYEAKRSSPSDDIGHVYDYQPRVFHDCLEKVEVIGWSGLKYEVQMIRYLIHTSPNLEHLVLDPTPPHQTETEWWRPAVPKLQREFEHAANVKQQLIHYLRECQRARTSEGEMIK